MKLEDTISVRLFRGGPSNYISGSQLDNTIIECRAESDKPVPLCVPPNIFKNADVVYKRLYRTGYPRQARSTPRALFNLIFSWYFSGAFIVEVELKNNIYYSAPGLLLDENMSVLYYFACSLDRAYVKDIPYLYISPLLLSNAAMQGKPMEKFFMSTIVPYLVNHKVFTPSGRESYTSINIDNDIDSTFFIPANRLVSSIPVDNVNAELNKILADNADMLSGFTEIYK